jgi:hypothetical protein
MKKFLVLYRSTASAQDRMSQMAKASPEQAKAGMDAWMGWAKRTGSALLELGAPTGESALLKGSPAVGSVGGYSLVQAESLEAAKKLFEGHPHFETPGASIEVLELVSIPGM